MAELPTSLWSRGDEDIDDLLDAYYAHIAPEDLAQVDEEQHRARVHAHLKVAAARTDSGPAVAVEVVARRSIVYVVTDDMPYLVDSVTAEVSRCGHAISLVVHPILLVTRSSAGPGLKTVKSLPTQGRSMSSGDTQSLPALSALLEEDDRTQVESWIAVELDRVISDQEAQDLTTGLHKALKDVMSSHRDQDRMIDQARRAAAEIRRLDDVADQAESADLVEWMGDGNFLFLGYREYSLAGEGEGLRLDPVPGTGLGILSDVEGTPRSRSASELSAAGRARARQRRALVITKANSRSTVRRRTYMDYVAAKVFDAEGEVIGERRFLGLFSQRAYTQSISTIPLLRSRAKQLLARSGFSPDSHSGSDLVQILETYPRNELLQMDITEVEEVSWQILQLQERRRVKLILRQDHFGRFMTALLYLPRDRYNTAVRRRVENELLRHVDAESIDFTVRLSDSVLARVFFRMRLRAGAAELALTTDELQERLAQVIRSWPEGIAQEASERYSDEHAEHISDRWGEAFPDDYRVLYEVSEALHDAAEFETLEAQPENGPRLYFYSPEDDDPADMRLKLYLTEAKTLTDTLPIIDDFNLSVLDERAYTLTTPDEETFYLYDLGLGYPESVDPHGTIELFKEAYHRVLTGRVESDVFSRLVLRLGMRIRSVTVLRAYAKYMRQLGTPHSYDFLAEALLANPKVTAALMDYFIAKFDPEAADDDAEEGAPRSQTVQTCRQQVLDALDEVATLDADRVLSTLLNLIDATDRTNLYQGHDWVALKLRPADIDSAPQPRPAHEIWVYSPEVEGTHLRFDRIARGGLRWSDRQEDFRTEVLGLVKAQMVKNSVIVPSGAKGGFYAKQLPDPKGDRSAWFEAGREAYKTFIRALLDVTDRQVEQDDGSISVVAPEHVVRHDDDDAYLVVAADKGTATFSDTANAISEEYGHWLGDAFASGGSAGYDHKAMGITARGAWESVKSHFASLGHDTQSQDFTVVAIGDMSGDVFGNGMLRSEHIQLVGAFNHLHIFVDPEPDAEASFQERQRLFEARGGWGDYDSELISAGGGVFSRTARSIEITPEMKERFGIDADELTPPELISALLKAPVDLLYNGGIGTYVKASHETHEEVGDRANNSIRVNGSDLRARVVAEGGNLGLTQAGRIEAAQGGVLLNSDAIDNSAGVESSDYEVNIKILLGLLVDSGHLKADERDEVLEEMTDDVAELVLQTNKDQNVLLLTDRQRLADWSPSFGRLIKWLESAAGLDRELEVLPTDELMAGRLDEGVPPLTSPELAVLAAYAKIQLKGAMVDSDLPQDPWFSRVLEEYFPDRITDHYAEQLSRHPLQHRIIVNRISNDAVNMGGSTFIFRTMEETFAAEDQVMRAFLMARDIFRLDEFDAQMRRLPVDFPSSARAPIYVDMRRLLDRAVRWFINNHSSTGSLSEDIAGYSEHIAPLYGSVAELMRGADAERVAAKRDEVMADGMNEQLADWYSQLFESYSLLDIAALAKDLGLESREVAEVYYAVYAEFDADTLLNSISSLPRRDKWQALARGAQRDELYYALSQITRSVLTGTDAASVEDRLAQWRQDHTSSLDRSERLIAEVRSRGDHSIASLTVLLRYLRGLTAG